jgi:hypothetical protein
MPRQLEYNIDRGTDDCRIVVIQPIPESLDFSLPAGVGEVDEGILLGFGDGCVVWRKGGPRASDDDCGHSPYRGAGMVESLEEGRV